MVCGYGGSPRDQARIALRLVRSGTAVGVVHAADDSVVPVAGSDAMVHAIHALQTARTEGGTQAAANAASGPGTPPKAAHLLRYWRYAHAPGPPLAAYAHLVGHGSYEVAFRDPSLYAWLLSHACAQCAEAAAAGVQPKWKPLHHAAVE